MLIAAAMALVLVAPATARGGAGPDLAHGGRLQPGRLGTGAALAFRDLARPDRGHAGAAAARAFESATAGGFYPTGDGYRVQIRGRGDAAAKQSVASFLGGLVHGAEIERLRVLITTAEGVARLCGSTEAVACYGDSSEMVMPSQAPDAENPLEEVVAHEYGHHIDLNRANPPWPEFNEAKRWFTQTRICPALRRGTYANDYRRGWGRDPSEYFAETNRLLNRGTFWRDDVAFPVPTASDLDALRADVLSPWRGPTTTTLSGTLSRSRPRRAYAIATPLDGTLKLRLSFARGRDFDLGLKRSGAVRFLRTSAGSARPEHLFYTVCGARNFTARVARHRGSGAFALTVTRP